VQPVTAGAAVGAMDPRLAGMSADVTSGKLGVMKSAVHFTFCRGEIMIRKTLVNVGVGALLGGMAVAAQAGTVTLTGTNHWGNQQAKLANVAPGNPTFGAKTVLAGALKGTVSGFTGSQSFANTAPNAFVAYCVEFTESFNTGTNMSYSLVNGASYAFGSNPPSTADSFAISLRLGKLFSYLDTLTGGAVVDTSSETAAVQLAVWEIIYEKPTAVDLSLDTVAGSNFFLTNDSPNRASLLAGANAYLNASASTANTYGVYVLTKGGNQDWLMLERGGGGPSNVPEPTSLALAFGALGLLGLASRRRKTTTA
jgi:hypothetical protein